MSNSIPRLSIEDCEHLFWLAARDYIFFSTYNESEGDWDDSWHIAVNCSDTFYYACADACEMLPLEAKEFRALIEQFGWAAGVAWSSIKRNEQPLKKLQTEQFYAALKHIKNNLT